MQLARLLILMLATGVIVPTLTNISMWDSQEEDAYTPVRGLTRYTRQCTQGRSGQNTLSQYAQWNRT